jgi:hypothetical protein
MRDSEGVPHAALPAWSHATRPIHRLFHESCGVPYPPAMLGSWDPSAYHPGSRYLRVSGQRSNRPSCTSVSA